MRCEKTYIIKIDIVALEIEYTSKEFFMYDALNDNTTNKLANGIAAYPQKSTMFLYLITS